MDTDGQQESQRPEHGHDPSRFSPPRMGSAFEPSRLGMIFGRKRDSDRAPTPDEPVIDPPEPETIEADVIEPEVEAIEVEAAELEVDQPVPSEPVEESNDSEPFGAAEIDSTDSDSSPDVDDELEAEADSSGATSPDASVEPVSEELGSAEAKPGLAAIEASDASEYDASGGAAGLDGFERDASEEVFSPAAMEPADADVLSDVPLSDTADTADAPDESPDLEVSRDASAEILVVGPPSDEADVDAPDDLSHSDESGESEAVSDIEVEVQVEAVEETTESNNEPFFTADGAIDLIDEIEPAWSVQVPSEPADASDDGSSADIASVSVDSADVPPLPTLDDLRTMAADLDDIDAVLQRLDSNPDDLSLADAALPKLT